MMNKFLGGYTFKWRHLLVPIAIIAIGLLLFTKLKDNSPKTGLEGPLLLSGVEGPIEDLTIDERFTIEIPGTFADYTDIDVQIKSPTYGFWKNLFGYKKTIEDWDNVDGEGLGRKFHFAGREFGPGNYTIVGIKSNDQETFTPVDVNFTVHETKPDVTKAKLQAQQASADATCLTGGAPVAITICIPTARIITGNFSVSNSFTVTATAPGLPRTAKLKLISDANELKACELGQVTCSSQVQADLWASGSSHTVEARIRTNNETLSKFVVTIKKPNEGLRGTSDTTVPELYLDGAKNGSTTGRNFEITGNASDQSGIAKVEFRVDNSTTIHHVCNPPNAPKEYRCKATFNLAAGPHTINVTATDTSNKRNTNTKSRTVTVNTTNTNTGGNQSSNDTGGPELFIDGVPNNSVVPGKVTLTANATDSQGVQRIKMTVDNQVEPVKKCINESAPQRLICVGTITLSPGQHTIVVTAVDGSARANETTKTRTYTVAGNTGQNPNGTTGGNPNPGTPNNSGKRAVSSGPLNKYQALTAKALNAYVEAVEEIGPHALNTIDSEKTKAPPFVKVAQAQIDLDLRDFLGDGHYGAFHLGTGIFIIPDGSNLASQLNDFDSDPSDDGNSVSGFQMDFKNITALYNYDPNDEFFSFLASYGLFDPTTGRFSPNIQRFGMFIGEPDAMAHEFVHRSFDVIPELQNFTSTVWGNLTKSEQTIFLVNLMFNAGSGVLYEASSASTYSNLTEFMAYLFESTGMTFEQTQSFFSGTPSVYEDDESIVFQTDFGLISFSKQRREFEFVLRNAAGEIVFARTLSYSSFNQIVAEDYGGRFEVSEEGWAIMINSKNTILAIFPSLDDSIPGIPPGEALYDPILHVGDPNNPDDDYIEGRLSNGDRLVIRPGATTLLTISRNHSTGETFVEINGFRFGSNDGRIINTNDGWGGNNPYDASNPNPCSYPSFQNTPQCGGGNATGGGGSGASPNNSCGAGMSALDCALLNNQN